MFQYGAIGMMLAVVVVTGLWLLHTFVPIWIHHFDVDEAVQRQNTATLQQISAAMTDIRTDIKASRDEFAGAIAVTLAAQKPQHHRREPSQ